MCVRRSYPRGVLRFLRIDSAGCAVYPRLGIVRQNLQRERSTAVAPPEPARGLAPLPKERPIVSRPSDKRAFVGFLCHGAPMQLARN